MTTVEQHDQDQPTDAPPYREPRLKTVQRQVRVTPELWAACARKAHAEGTTLGSVIRQMLEEYLES